MKGTFTYQNKIANQAVAYLVVAVSAAAAYITRLIWNHALLTAGVLIVGIFLLAGLSMPLSRHFFTKEGSYSFDEDGDTVTVNWEGRTLTLNRDQVKGVGCDPVEDRKKTGVRMYCISIITPDREKNYRIYSENVMADNRESQQSIKQFTRFGDLLKTWKYGAR